MTRDSLLDEAEKKQREQEEQDATAAEESDQERDRHTLRIPPRLTTRVDTVQEKYSLPSRNAAMNFMLTHAADDLLEE